MNADNDEYEREQRKAIIRWKESSPPIMERALGYLFKPLSWGVQTFIPSSAIEGALKAADWLARQTIFEQWIYSTSIDGTNNQKSQLLSELDARADSFHRWAIGMAVVEGAGAGAAGLPGLAVDIPTLITLTLRTIRGIGVCYGFNSDSETEREFVLGVLAAASANSMAEKTAALVLLRQLEITVLQQTFKAMAIKAAEQSVSKEAAIIALRDLARQLGLNLTKRKMLQAVPILGAVIGAAVNWKFMDDVAWAARRAYQDRWLEDRDRRG